MGAMACQIIRLVIVYSTVYSGAVQRQYQSSASLVFVPVNSLHKGQWRGKCFHLMTSSWGTWVHDKHQESSPTRGCQAGCPRTTSRPQLLHSNPILNQLENCRDSRSEIMDGFTHYFWWHNNVMTWKRFKHYWFLVIRIQRSLEPYCQ